MKSSILYRTTYGYQAVLKALRSRRMTMLELHEETKLSYAAIHNNINLLVKDSLIERDNVIWRKGGVERSDVCSRCGGERGHLKRSTWCLECDREYQKKYRKEKKIEKRVKKRLKKMGFNTRIGT